MKYTFGRWQPGANNTAYLQVHEGQNVIGTLQEDNTFAYSVRAGQQSYSYGAAYDEAAAKLNGKKFASQIECLDYLNGVKK